MGTTDEILVDYSEKVHGYCIGGSLDLASNCDLVVAADDADNALDLMGRPMMKKLAVEADAMAHKTEIMKTFYEVGLERGLRAAYQELEGA